MITKRNDSLSYAIYKYKYHNSFYTNFNYEISKQSINENQINTEDFSEYLNKIIVNDADGCAYSTYWVAYSGGDEEYYGVSGFWTTPVLITCGFDNSGSNGGGGTGGQDNNDSNDNNTEDTTHGDIDSETDNNNTDTPQSNGSGGQSSVPAFTVNEPDNNINVRNAISNFFDSLSVPEREAITIENYVALSDFLQKNVNLDIIPTNIIDFANQAVQAIIDGGEFHDGIIIDSTIVNNTRVHNIYNKLINQTNTIFSDIINNNFQSSKVTNIRFRIGNTPNGEDAYTKGSTNNGISSSYDIIINSNLINSLSNVEIALIFIHESIHAELLERCVQLGIISNFILDANGYSNPVFTNSLTSFTTQDALFAGIVNFYINYPSPNNSQWNHDLFTLLNYRNVMSQNLINIHPTINDINNDFLTNINSDPLNTFGNFTLQEVMNYISWIGLEGTQDYINTIQNNPLELSKKVYIESAARLFYSHN